MNILRSAVLTFGFFILASGIAHPFEMIDRVNPMRAHIEIKNVEDKTEMTLRNLNNESQESYPRTANLDSKTKVVISGKEANYVDLSRFDGKYAEISGEIAYVYRDYKMLLEWRTVRIQPIPPEKTK